MRLEAVLSYRIEGTQTSVGELLLFEADDHGDDPPEADDSVVGVDQGALARGARVSGSR